MNSPVVSVVIITYQHLRFIRRCVEGALSQRTTFPFEILIGEDESTDGTREICQQLAAEHPEQIRLFLRSRKDVVCIDGQPRGGFNFRVTMREARGELIAYVEGDDYWTDPEKLQRQVDYLRANPDCNGCFHESSLVDAEERELQANYLRSQYKVGQEKFDERDCLVHLQSKYATCSLMFRRTAIREWPEWYLRRPSDFSLDLLLTHDGGKLGFIDRTMAAYRRHPGGVWSGQPKVVHVIEMIIRLKILLAEPHFLDRYRAELLQAIGEFQAMLFTYDEVEARVRAQLGPAQAQIDQGKARLAGVEEILRGLTEERTRLIGFVNRQHAMIKELQSQSQVIPLGRGAAVERATA
jgi:glycosyltransferase involved in cell wall biosynthesis